MRLIRLSANQKSFKTVEFNPTGLTLIVGAKSKGGETYNGVGKSLIIELLHFCLGSTKNPEFETKIPQWEFTLAFELSDGPHSVSRNTSQQGVLIFDHQELRLTAFNAWMEERLFSIPEGVPSLTYRALLPKFMRRGQKQYTDPRYTGDYSEFDMLIRNSFLLGIDVHLVAAKAQVRDEIKKLQTLRKNFKDDPLLRDFYMGGKDADIQLSYLEGRIREMARDKNAFVVAENYYEMQKAANQLAAGIEHDKNAAFLIKSALENIDRSIKEQPDLPLERLHQLYGELTEAFKPEALRRLDDVAGFHQRLLANRLARLSREKMGQQDKLKEVEGALRKRQAELDQQLKALGEARALDQYTALVNEIAELTAQVRKLKDYQAIDLEYSNREANLEGRMSDEVIKTNDYLEETKALRDQHFTIFKDFVARFYPTSPAGISLHNNEKKGNMKRFDLVVRVENDSSDGINEVRIFCYDLTLLCLKQGHKIDFLFHDSRLYANMDVRQRAMLFRIANEVAAQRGCQYIATLNPDFISGMASEFAEDEFERIVTRNVVLELKDDSPAGKLLGLQVDMHYEER
ncbi:MAG: hypothetical protein COZ11_05600 [Deltaproteobacteria bacterium CG_4_10_14_3_um_filter_51_14]|nr:MAG: hypothetical protein COZ11_05600 [Deltaproteobacteria bacterium CG_4_10_14_3_um_filter_51_14]